MKKHFIVLILLFGIFISAQTNRFLYKLEYRQDSSQTYKEEVMALDINPKEVKFYDYKFAQYDSINKKSYTGNVSRFSTKTDQVLTRKINSFSNNWYRDFLDYFVVKTKDEMIWKLFPETKEYQGYQLQKATTTFGGRNWEAWFSKDIAIKEGPYKFRGLPGLIFLLEDSQKDFKYQLIKNIKLTDVFDTMQLVESHYGKPAIAITNEIFNKYVEELYADPVRSFSSQIPNGGKVTFNNAEETVESLNTKKKMLQKGIKNRYVYIEKNHQPNFN